MSGATDQLGRLLTLIPWLRAHPGVSTDEVLRQFNLTHRELADDLKLVSVCGVPGGAHGELFDIDFYADDVDDDDDDAVDVTLGSVITVHDAQTLQRPMRLAPTEAATLLLGLRLLSDLPGTFDRGRIDALTGRLESLAGDAVAQMDEALAVGEQRTVDAAVLATIEEVVSGQKAVRLEYYVPSRDEVTERVVDPISLGVTDGHHYLTAWCRTAEERRTFRLDRVFSATPTGEAALSRPLPVADDPYRYTPDGDAIRAVIRLEPAALWLLEHAVVEQVVDLDHGAVEATLATHSEQWLAQLVLRAGAGAQVLSPDSLRALVRTQAAAALAAHQPARR